MPPSVATPPTCATSSANYNTAAATTSPTAASAARRTNRRRCSAAPSPTSTAAQQENAFRLLNLNYSLIGYISALGAYRSQIENREHDPFLARYYPLGASVADLLEQLEQLPPDAFAARLQHIRTALDQLRPREDDPDLQHSILWQQLLMITRTLEPCYQALAPA